MGQKMGWGDSFGLADSNACFKRKNRWLFMIPDISAEGINALPPSKASRPSISFKELSVEHLNETIYYPGKPEWKSIVLTLYDIYKPQNKIWEWINSYYDVENEKFKYSVGFKQPRAQLILYDGTGEKIETWFLHSVWCQDISFGDLDMGSSEIATVDLTLRYDRATYLS
jgi:hypothetical protein